MKQKYEYKYKFVDFYIYQYIIKKNVKSFRL